MKVSRSENGYLYFARHRSDNKIDRVFIDENECLEYVREFNDMMKRIK